MTGDQGFVLLLVEDNPDDVLFLRRAFSRIGRHFPVVIAEDGEQALSYLSGNGPPTPTHVLLDLKLPKKTGLEVLEWMKGDGRTAGLPVAILSSSGQTSDRERARELGAERYWIKPAAFDHLMRIAGEIVEWMQRS